jgi:hypothetical protein
MRPRSRSRSVTNRGRVRSKRNSSSNVSAASTDTESEALDLNSELKENNSKTDKYVLILTLFKFLLVEINYENFFQTKLDVYCSRTNVKD